MTRPQKRSEHTEQVALFDWANRNKYRYPELQLMFAIPNGGKRHIGVARKLKAEGVKAGVPDIFLPVPRTIKDKFIAGLFIEMKYGKNKPTPSQQEWVRKLRKYGYWVVVCYSYEEAQEIITSYILNSDIYEKR